VVKLIILTLTGYSIEEQLKLFASIKPLFKNKPLMLILNKIDQQKYEELSARDREMIEEVAKENNTFLIKMSNLTGEGVADVKAKSCDILLEYRMNSKSKGNTEKVIENVNNRIYIATPIQRDARNRPTQIPKEVLKERKHNPMPEGQLEKKLLHNPVKEMIDKHGGEGVFYVQDRTHFQLAKPEWKDDILPEFMDGKNIFDFVDPDIKEKLERLEEEEEAFLKTMDNNKMDLEEDDSEDGSDDISEDLLELHKEVMDNKKIIRQRHELVTRSQLPRRVRDLTETEKMMVDIRQDKKEVIGTMKLLGTQKKREREDKKKTMELIRKEEENKKRQDFEDEERKFEEFDEENEMDIDEGDPEKMSMVQKSRLRKVEKMNKKNEDHNKVVTERIKRKIQKKWSIKCVVNEADRSVPCKMPKHLNTGVRGIGKNDRR
jgi:nucleolar GTP-binding protein